MGGDREVDVLYSTARGAILASAAGARYLEAAMVTLRMQHSVQDFDSWKTLFDADPLDRKGSGVTAYRVFRPAEDAGQVMIDLDFGSHDEAEQFLERLKALWRGPAASTIQDVQAWVLEFVESATP